MEQRGGTDHCIEVSRETTRAWPSEPDTVQERSSG
jgi:hypothetical protein